MNTGHDDFADQRLRLALRGMRRDLAPGRDLWPEIAARIADAPRMQAPPPPARRWIPALALAASLVLAVGVAWRQQPLPSTVAPAPAPALTPVASVAPLQVEALAMTRQYQAALLELERSAPQAAASPLAPTLRELDRSAAQIRTALEHDPGARFLLDQLRRTYAQRLALTQRAAFA
ncbi:MAG TPA: hypothetical protein VM576_06865 [Xanthomonadaceae bacterium]|nr:hypothetical protein [Xanthomonadaceae bacterium]